MSKLNEQIIRIFDLTKNDPKPIYGVLAHLTSEVGELAEAVEHYCGHLPNKTMSEPIVGEVADVIQCALSVLAKAMPGYTNANRLQMLELWMTLKTNKWEKQLSPKAQQTPVMVNPMTARVLKVNPMAALVKSNFTNSVIQAPVVQEPKLSLEKRRVYIDIRKDMVKYFAHAEHQLKTGKRRAFMLTMASRTDGTPVIIITLRAGDSPILLNNPLFCAAFRKQTETGPRISLGEAYAYLHDH